MNKLQKYINEITKFLNEKYFCYPLKIQIKKNERI